MKPTCTSSGSSRAPSGARPDRRRFPLTDYCFQSGFDKWRGYSHGDDSRRDFRNFCRLNRLFLAEAAREYSREMIVFSVMVVASAWLVIYMVFTVVTLLARSQP